MDTTTISLLFGSFVAGLIWWGSTRLANRCAGKAEKTNSSSEDLHTQEDAPWDRTERVYRKILYIRLAGFTLCLLAAGSLLLRAGTAVAVILAGLGLFLQYTAFRKRTEHVFLVKKATENMLLAKKKAQTE